MSARIRNSKLRRIGDRAPWAVLLGGLIVAGCSSGPYESAPVNIDKARETLTATLESWKGGETTEDLQEHSPSIVVQDLDWSAGMKLLEYEVLEDEKPESANLVAKVKLSLEDSGGAKLEKTVTYLVGTAPVLTVFRDMFR